MKGYRRVWCRCARRKVRRKKGRKRKRTSVGWQSAETEKVRAHLSPRAARTLMQRLTSFIADEVRFETVDPPEKTLMRRIKPAVMACRTRNISFLPLFDRRPRRETRATHAKRSVEEGAAELSPLPQYIEDISAGPCCIRANGEGGEAVHSRTVGREELAVDEDLGAVVVGV